MKSKRRSILSKTGKGAQNHKVLDSSADKGGDYSEATKRSQRRAKISSNSKSQLSGLDPLYGQTLLAPQIQKLKLVRKNEPGSFSNDPHSQTHQINVNSPPQSDTKGLTLLKDFSPEILLSAGTDYNIHKRNSTLKGQIKNDNLIKHQNMQVRIDRNRNFIPLKQN